MITNIATIPFNDSDVFDAAGHMITFHKDDKGSYINFTPLSYKPQLTAVEVVTGLPERVTNVIRFDNNLIVLECGRITYQIKDMLAGVYMVSIDNIL